MNVQDAHRGRGSRHLHGSTNLDLRIVSSDSHVVEPSDLWQGRVNRRYRDEAPKLVSAEDADWIEVGGARTPLSCVAATGERFVDGSGPQSLLAGRFSRVRPGGYVPAEMLKDMDVDGVDAQILYPSLGLLLYGLPGSELVTELFRAYNDWLAEFVSVGPRRLKGVALLNVDDVAVGVRELERASGLGLAGAAIAVGPQTPYGSPAYEPLWSTAEALRVPLSLHVGTNRPGTGVDFLNLDLSSPLMGSLMSSIDHYARLAVADMIFTGVFELHPDLHVGIIEQDAGWIPYWLWKMDVVYEELQPERTLGAGMLPSDYFDRNVYVSFQEDVSAIAQRDRIGVDSLAFGTDYPHYEGTFPQTRTRLAELLAACTDDERAKIAGGNVARIYGIS